MTPMTRQCINRHLHVRDHVFYRRRTSTLHGSLLSRRFKGALSRKEIFTGSQRESSTHATIALISTYHTKPTKPLSSGTVMRSVSGRLALPGWRSWMSLIPLSSNQAVILNLFEILPTVARPNPQSDIWRACHPGVQDCQRHEINGRAER